MEIRRVHLSDMFGLDFLEISWDIMPQEVNLSEYEFIVERSDSPEGVFKEISPVLTGELTFRDYTVELFTSGNRYVYQIMYRHVPTAEEAVWQVSPQSPQYKQNHPDIIAAEIIRREQIYLDRARAALCGILLRRTYGDRCTACWDHLRREPGNSYCPICYGTGWVGGYWGPYFRRVSFSLTKKQERLVNFQRELYEEEPFQGWITNTPPLRAGDIIVTPFNKRYRVNNIGTSKRGGTILHQIFVGFPLEVTNLAYDIEVVVPEAPSYDELKY